MSLSSFTSLMESNCKVNGGKEDYFDLLDFPDEIIDEIFSYLPIKDRLRVRMNTRLAMIVADSKYYVESVCLKVKLGDWGTRSPWCSIGRTQSYPLDFIKMFANNISIGELFIFLRSDPQLEKLEIFHDFWSIIKQFRSITELHLCCGEKANEIITDSFFFDLSRRCEWLSLSCRVDGGNQISTEILHNVYKGMKDGSSRARFVRFSGMKRQNRDAFLNFLGVVYRDDRVISNRNIQVYRKAVDYKCIITIYDGLIRTSFEYVVGVVENDYDRTRYINIKSYENEEALIKDKMPLRNEEGFIVERLDVYPE